MGQAAATAPRAQSFSACDLGLEVQSQVGEHFDSAVPAGALRKVASALMVCVLFGYLVLVGLYVFPLADDGWILKKS